MQCIRMRRLMAAAYTQLMAAAYTQLMAAAYTQLMDAAYTQLMAAAYTQLTLYDWMGKTQTLLSLHCQLLSSGKNC